MIIEFYVENFRSFKNRETFSLIPDSGKSKLDNIFNLDLKEGNSIRLLKSAVVYGANGSGKSNFVKSIYALKWLVVKSANFSVGSDIRCYEPYELDVDTQDKPCKLGLTFIMDHTRYKYEIEYLEEEILSEKLDIYESNQPSNLFERKLDDGEHEDYVEVKLGRSLVDKKIAKKVFKNQLYLSRFGSEIPHDHLTKVFKYFANLEIWNALDKRDVNRLSNEISKKISKEENSKFSARLSKLVRIADIKIESLHAKELDEEHFSFPEEIPDDVKNKFIKENKIRTFATHKLFENDKEIGTVDFDLNVKESRGTKVLFALGGIILDALEDGGIVLFDELDNSLHPKLCKFLIRLFNNPVSNPNNAQLIFATHEVTLLDKDTFRKDQIWFTEKDKFGTTELFSAKDVEGLRDDTNFELWYRTGKFGGNPKIKEVEFIFGNE
jgi:hypothetical protein